MTSLVYPKSDFLYRHKDSGLDIRYASNTYKALATDYPSSRQHADPIRETVWLLVMLNARIRLILAAVRDTKRMIITVGDAAIEQAQQELAKKGFYIEPTSAVSYAGLVEYAKQSLGGQDCFQV